MLTPRSSQTNCQSPEIFRRRISKAQAQDIRFPSLPPPPVRVRSRAVFDDNDHGSHAKGILIPALSDDHQPEKRVCLRPRPSPFLAYSTTPTTPRVPTWTISMSFSEDASNQSGLEERRNYYDCPSLLDSSFDESIDLEDEPNEEHFRTQAESERLFLPKAFMSMNEEVHSGPTIVHLQPRLSSVALKDTAGFRTDFPSCIPSSSL